MPVCVLSDVTTGHTKSSAKIYIIEKSRWHCIKCGLSNSLIFVCLCVEIYKSMYYNTNSSVMCCYSLLYVRVRLLIASSIYLCLLVKLGTIQTDSTTAAYLKNTRMCRSRAKTTFCYNHIICIHTLFSYTHPML